ncbi:MAG: amidohydrolase [Oscillospiraceae bacterium]|nr:amidohydrolase [Oscillospiraceae bacterium]
MNPYQLTEEEFQRALALRRDLHMHPELSGREVRTTAKLREFFAALPMFRILSVPVETGLVLQLPGSGQGPEIMLRADIDALPQQEQYESPWRSQTDGVMHACGHDLHTAALAGAALVLARLRDTGKLPDTVDLVFQSAEEETTGAKALLDAGLFDHIHPDFCFGLHNWPSVPTGSVVCRERAVMAAKKNFEIRIHGFGGHGSMPQLNIDPIVCAAAVIQSLQTVVSRNMDPREAVVMSVNAMEGGSAANLVVEDATLRATVRALSEAAMTRATERIEAIVANTAAAYECRSAIVWHEDIAAVWNTPEMTVRARRCVEAAGLALTDAPPSLASEDVSLYRAHVPSFFYWVGSTAPGERGEELHRPLFHADDNALRCAAALYAASAIESQLK